MTYTLREVYVLYVGVQTLRGVYTVSDWFQSGTGSPTCTQTVMTSSWRRLTSPPMTSAELRSMLFRRSSSTEKMSIRCVWMSVTVTSDLTERSLNQSVSHVNVDVVLRLAVIGWNLLARRPTVWTMRLVARPIVETYVHLVSLYMLRAIDGFALLNDRSFAQQSIDDIY